ncbi:hypothetical protein [Phyllobacterium sp. YR620]|uniref:hypothetical protein n=1 Tax=Phyllobacterium sp. YR620 TaxID=1881066 RepID=UPI0015873A4E
MVGRSRMFADRAPGNLAGRVLTVNLQRDTVLEKYQRPRREHRKRRDPVDQHVAADPLGPEFGKPHARCNLYEFVRRKNRELPFVAHFGAARIPGLATAGFPRRASMEITDNSVESDVEFR